MLDFSPRQQQQKSGKSVLSQQNQQNPPQRQQKSSSSSDRTPQIAKNGDVGPNPTPTAAYPFESAPLENGTLTAASIKRNCDIVIANCERIGRELKLKEGQVRQNPLNNKPKPIPQLKQKKRTFGYGTTLQLKLKKRTDQDKNNNPVQKQLESVRNDQPPIPQLTLNKRTDFNQYTYHHPVHQPYPSYTNDWQIPQLKLQKKTTFSQDANHNPISQPFPSVNNDQPSILQLKQLPSVSIDPWKIPQLKLQKKTTFGQDANHNPVQQLPSNDQSQIPQLKLKKRTTMAATSPANSDSNCNPYLPAASVPLSCSIASSQDFSHDYSDYQWFMDYGSYRDGITHQSILSALSASYNGIGELSYYEDLAKNIDANLAEVDMESFRTEDIHSLLTTNSAEFRRGHNRNNNRGESMLTGGTGANRSGLELNLSGRHLNGGGGAGGMDSSEICKSELLFSPVKESHISVDSLDMDGYPDEDDVLLTCQANKNNYTLMFEQSALFSDESYFGGLPITDEYINRLKFKSREDFFPRNAEPMSTSEVSYTTWDKLRNNSGSGQRFPLVTAANPFISQISRHAPTCFVRKSLSMPDLKEKSSSQPFVPQEQQQPGEPKQINVSQVVGQHQQQNSCAASSESYGKQMRTLLPMPSDFGGNSGGPNGGDGSQANCLRDSSCE